MAEKNTYFDGEMDFVALFEILWRGKYIILMSICITIFFGFAYALFIATPKYTSSAILAIQERGSPMVDIESVVSGVSAESESLNTETEVLRSRGLLERLATELDLSNDPEFNPYIRPVSPFSLQKIGKLIGAQEKATPSDQEVLNQIVENLRSSISASVRRQTFLISISASTQSPEKSRLVVNTLASIYLDDQIQVKFETLDNAVTWLSDRVIELEAELKQREEELKARTSEAEYINSASLLSLNQQMREMRERMIGEQTDSDRARESYRVLIAAVEAQDVASILETTQDPVLTRLAQTTSAPDFRDRTSEFSKRLSTLLDRRRTDAERAETQVDALSHAISSMETRVDDQAAKLASLQQLQREIDATSVLYDTFLTRLKETTIQQGIQQSEARILSAAIAGEMVSPRTSLIGVLSLVFGALAGAALAFLHEMRANGFRNADDLQAETGLQVIGQIPLFPLEERSDLLQYLKDKPTSPAVEAVRNMRTSILLSNVDSPPRVIMSTSTIPGEGKTTNAISLVQNLASMGHNVLLIEGDIRRRTLDEYFEAAGDGHGLLSVISGEADLANTVVRSDRVGADILMGQTSHINAADVFSSDKFVSFLKDIRKTYDYVVIDTPPVLVVPDARVIGQHCDAIVYSVKWDSTTKSQVKAALRELAAVNLKPSGLVLSQVDPKGMKKYGYGEAHGAYSNYGGDYYEA